MELTDHYCNQLIFASFQPMPSLLYTTELSRIAGIYLTDDLELFTVLIIAGQQEPAILARPLPRTMVPSHHHQIQCISHPLQVVLFQLYTKSNTQCLCADRVAFDILTPISLFLVKISIKS